MLTPEQIENKLDRILLKVQKPGRYVGGELNSIVKDWDKVQTKVAFVFPDIYVGQGSNESRLRFPGHL